LINMKTFRAVHYFALLTLCTPTLGQAPKELGDLGKGCASGTYRQGEYCYTVSPISVTYENAELLCESGGGILAPIKDRSTQYFVQKLRIRKFVHRYWIGMNDRQKEATWVYSDGSRLQGFSRWHRGEPNNLGGNQHCVCMWTERHLDWDDASCALKLLYVCQFEGATECLNKSRPVLGHLCYYLSHSLATFDEAELACRAMGGILATPKTQATHDFLRKIIYNERFWLEMSDDEVDNVYRMQSNFGSFYWDTWMGVKYDPLQAKWVYSDGGVANFTLWAPGEPNNNRGHEDCVKMGQTDWQDMQCDFKFSFVCQYPAVKPTSQPLPVINSPKALHQTRGSPSERDGSVHLGVTSFVLILVGCVLMGMMSMLIGYLGYSLYSHRYSNTPQRMEEEQDRERLQEDQSGDPRLHEDQPGAPDMFIYKNDRVVSLLSA